MMDSLPKVDELLIRSCKALGLSSEQYLDIYLLLQNDRQKALFGTWLKPEMKYPDLLHLAAQICRGRITEPPDVNSDAENEKKAKERLEKEYSRYNNLIDAEVESGMSYQEILEGLEDFGF